MVGATKEVIAYNKALFEQGLTKCNVCKEIKPLNEFHKDKLRKDGRQSVCKGCRKQYQKNYQPQYYEDNKERIIEWNKQYRQDNKEKIKEEKKQYRQDNKAKLNEYQKNKRKNNIVFALRCNVSSQVSMALKRNSSSKQGESLMKYLPYTIDQLKEHLENQFEDWMTWENHGVYHPTEKRWHIDHIIPQNKLIYDSMDHPNFQNCWALENLQPLLALDNLSKGDKILDEE